jgi:hypothetical protein
MMMVIAGIMLHSHAPAFDAKHPMAERDELSLADRVHAAPKVGENARAILRLSRKQAMYRPTTIERAYELARSGPCHSLNEVRAQLKRERHESIESHLSGPTIGRQLRALLLQKRSAPAIGTAG